MKHVNADGAGRKRAAVQDDRRQIRGPRLEAGFDDAMRSTWASSKPARNIGLASSRIVL